MIKNFKLYKESLLNKLQGPTEEEILNENPDLFLKISIEDDNVEGVKKALNHGANPFYNYCYLFNLCGNEEIKKLLFEYSNLPKSVDDFIKILFKNVKLNNPYNVDTERYSNEYGVLFYITDKYMELSSEIYYIFYNVYSKSKAEIHKLFIDYFNLDNKTLHVMNFSSFKLNKMLFDNKQLKESLLNKLQGLNEQEVWDNIGKPFIGLDKPPKTAEELFDYIVDNCETSEDPYFNIIRFNNRAVTMFIPTQEVLYVYDKILIILDAFYNIAYKKDIIYLIKPYHIRLFGKFGDNVIMTTLED